MFKSFLTRIIVLHFNVNFLFLPAPFPLSGNMTLISWPKASISLGFYVKIDMDREMLKMLQKALKEIGKKYMVYPAFQSPRRTKCREGHYHESKFISYSVINKQDRRTLVHKGFPL